MAQKPINWIVVLALEFYKEFILRIKSKANDDVRQPK